MSCASSPRATGLSATAMTRSASLANRSFASNASALSASVIGRIPSAVRMCVHSSMVSLGAPFTYATSLPLTSHTTVMRLRDESNGNSKRRGRSASRSSMSKPAFAAETSIAASVGSPRIVQTSVPSAGARSRALLQSTAAAKQSSSRVLASPVTDLPSSVNAPVGA
jgi:hypothetical protein